MLMLTLLRPEALWLLLVVPLVFVWPRALGNERAHGLLRSLLLAAVVVAIAGPVSVVEDTRHHHVLLVDASASTTEAAEARQTAQRLLTSLGEDEAHAIHVVGLGFTRDQLDAETRVDSFATLDAGASDLGAALTLAAARIPTGSKGAITLLSDGHATTRSWGAATQALTARKIPLHTIPLATPAGDVRPVALLTPDDLRVGQTARVFVDVVGTSADVKVALTADGKPVATSTTIRIQGRGRVPLEFEPESAGFVDYLATVEVTRGTDVRAANNALARRVAVQDPIRVLYLGSRVQDSDKRLGELLGKGFELDKGQGPEGAKDLGQYDLVMFDDRPSKDVPREFQRQVVAAVTDHGLGLVMAGGSSSFGPGGYHQTPIESVLPVELVQKEEKKDPSTSLAIIIDTSGSMGGNRIILAKEVTRLALRRLLPHDKVGIVEFYGNKRWAAPLQSAANAIDIQRALNRLDAGGGTILYPAIEEAYFGLRNVQTRYKHVLVLTDAGVETGPYEQLLRRMSRDGICVSTVLVGPGRHSEFLVELADWGRGRFYNASDRFNMPEVMLKQPSSARLPGYRTGAQTVDALGGPGWWGDTDPTKVPSIGGYVETRPRPGADTILRTQRDRHPVLSSWRFGLGRVTAMMTEPTGPGTESFKNWDDYGRFLGRVLARTAANDRLPFRFALRRDGTRLVLDATRLDSGSALPQARVGDTDFAFVERAPGHFRAVLAWPVAQAADVVASVQDGRGHGFKLTAGPRSDIAPEANVDPTQAFDLDAAATATGGVSLDLRNATAASLTAGGGTDPRALRDLAPWCLLVALLLYLADLLWRRRPAGVRS